MQATVNQHVLNVCHFAIPTSDYGCFMLCCSQAFEAISFFFGQHLNICQSCMCSCARILRCFSWNATL